MSNVVRVEYNIKTNINGSDCGDILEFDREEWEDMTENEREEIIRDAAFEHVEWYYQEVE